MTVTAIITPVTAHYSCVITQAPLKNYSFIIENNVTELCSTVEDQDINLNVTNKIVESVSNTKNYSFIIEQFNFEANTVVQDPSDALRSS